MAPIDGLPPFAEWERLGRGGFGVVYRAYDIEHARHVAVKVLTSLELDDAALKVFHRERTAMGALSGHPNIVTVHSSGVTPAGVPYLVMEFLAGGSAADALIARGPWPWVEAAVVGMRIAGALEAAHRHGVLHRDVKPANVLLTSWGECKLGDFGIARMTTATTTETTTSASVAHAAPEVLEGKRGTPASDVYSLGSTLYELVHGHPPFWHPGDESILPFITRILFEPAPALDGVPRPLADAVRSALAKDPSQRPATALAFGEQLQQVLMAEGHTAPRMLVDLHMPTGVGAPAAPGDSTAPLAADAAAAASLTAEVTLPGRPPTVQQAIPAGNGPGAVTVPTALPLEERVPSAVAPRRRGRVGMLVSAAVVVALLAGTVVAVLATRGSGDPATLGAVPPLETAPPAATGASPPDAAPGVAAPSATARGSVVYRDGGALWVVAPDGSGVHSLGIAGVGPPALSPDGTQVAYATESGQLRVTALAEGDTTTLVPAGARDPAWSPDGRSLAYAAVADGVQDLWVIAAEGGTPERVTEATGREGSPAWFPDGGLLAYDTDQGGTFDIWLVDIASHRTRQLTDGPAQDETPAVSPNGEKVVFARRDEAGSTDLWLVNRADGSTTRLTDDAGDESSPAFSPDGGLLVFAANRSANFDLWTVDIASGLQTGLVERPGDQTDPDWEG